MNSLALRKKISRGNFPNSKSKKSALKKCLIFREMELSNLKLKKVFIFQERTLKSQAKKVSYFLRVSKNEFIHSSS